MAKLLLGTMSDGQAPSVKDFLRHGFDPYPRQIRIESSSACPMSCAPCHFHGGKNPAFPLAKKATRPMARIDHDLFEHLIREIATWPAPLAEIVPTSWGEWFMHPRWHDQGLLIDELLPKTKIALPTTGTLVNDEVLMKLASLKTLKHLNISVNAFFAETYELFHGVPATHLPRIRKWAERFKDMRPDCHLQFSMVYDPVTHGQTEIERDLFRAYWQPLGTVEINTTSYASHPGKKLEHPTTLPCRSVFDGLVVAIDGRVGTGCCFDADMELTVGKVPEEKLLDIWNGEKLREYGRVHNEGRRNSIPICSGCSFA